MKKMVFLIILTICFCLSACGDSDKQSKEISQDKEIKATKSAEEYLGLNFYDVMSELEGAGFTEIETEVIKDMDVSSTMEDGYVESVTIDGSSSFDKNTAFASGSKVIISYHTLKECKVKIHIDFVENLIFSKYDIEMSIDDNLQETLSHGQDGDYEYELTVGEHKLTFLNAEDSNIKGEVTIEVKSDLKASYKISCYSSEIRVETQYIDSDIPLQENQVKVSKSASDYVMQNYEVAISEMKEMGFENIETLVLYDIVFGITEEGEIEAVEIDGNADFKKGDIYDKSAKVVITYHSDEENDPAKKQDEWEDEEEPEESQKIHTVKNCKALKKMLGKKSENDPSYVKFADTYSGEIIKFNGSIDNMQHHGDYKTRWDILMSAGKYSETHQVGPAFKFEDVNIYDLNTELDSVRAGMNVTITAEVERFDTEQYIFYLKPVKIEGR